MATRCDVKAIPIVWSTESEHPIIAALRDGPKSSRELADALGYGRPDSANRAAQPLVRAGKVERGNRGGQAVYRLP